MERIKQHIPMPARRRWGRIKHRTLYPRWARLKCETNGMLGPDVYRAIHRNVKDRADPNLDIVEVGAAAGSATIAAALAIQANGGTGRVVAIEKAEGGSRDKYGDKANNLDILRSNLHNWDVEDRVTLFTEQFTLDNADQVKTLIRTPQLGALMHDADGNIHRDFATFWPMLADGAPIILDDCWLRETGMKAVVTYRLFHQFVAWGLVELVQMKGNTAFAIKPSGATFNHFDLETCQAIVDRVHDERG